MNFDEFKKTFPPSKSRVEIDNTDWSRLELQTGYKFPSEYKHFIDNYGTVELGEYLNIFNPFSKNRALNIEGISDAHEAYGRLKQLFPKNFPRPRFPQNGSFLPWGITWDGDILFWNVSGHPDDWTVGVDERSMHREVLFDLSTLDFLSKLALGELESDAFPNDFLTKIKVFSPINNGSS